MGAERGIIMKDIVEPILTKFFGIKDRTFYFAISKDTNDGYVGAALLYHIDPYIQIKVRSYNDITKELVNKTISNAILKDSIVINGKVLGNAIDSVWNVVGSYMVSKDYIEIVQGQLHYISKLPCKRYYNR